MSAAVDTDALLELAWAAPLAVLVVTVSWGLVIYGTTRAVDLRRDGRIGMAGAHAFVAITGGLVFAATLVAGIIVMATK